MNKDRLEKLNNILKELTDVSETLKTGKTPFQRSQGELVRRIVRDLSQLAKDLTNSDNRG